ncbi:MAG: helix-turn-helix transcriptional regulator [Acidimicrobiales bacterium]
MALLSEPIRRSLYRYVAWRGRDVGREEAASAVGVDRSLAAFHLDKLVERGLLEATYRRLTGRTGPGSGRPSKLYRRSACQHELTLPPRRYELAARLLVAGVESSGEERGARAVDEAAGRFGREVGVAVREDGGAVAADGGLAALTAALEAHGYEPVVDGATVRLRNCPFHALAEGHRALVCGMNQALVAGVVEGLGAEGLEARPEFEPGHCCVTVAVGPRRT